MGSLNKSTPFHIISPCKKHMLHHVSMHSHVRDAIQWYEAMRTRTAIKIPDAGQKYSDKDVSFVKCWCFQRVHLLLFVVCRICEYTGVEPMPDSITRLNCHSVLVCCHKFIIEDDCPLSMVYFSFTMCHKRGIGALPANVICSEGFESIQNLSFNRIEGSCSRQLKKLHAPSPGRQCVQMDDMKVSTFDPLTGSLSQDKLAIVECY